MMLFTQVSEIGFPITHLFFIAIGITILTCFVSSAKSESAQKSWQIGEPKRRDYSYAKA